MSDYGVFIRGGARKSRGALYVIFARAAQKIRPRLPSFLPQGVFDA